VVPQDRPVRVAAGAAHDLAGVDEVGHEAPDQPRVPGGHGGRQVLRDQEAALGSQVLARGDLPLDDVGEVEGDPAGGAALAGGQGEQGVDEPLLVLTDSEGLLACRAKGVGVGGAQRAGVPVGVTQHASEVGPGAAMDAPPMS
jgi:hypothetical protein